MTFVLILVSRVYLGAAIATVPGYDSERLCQDAGEAYVKDSRNASGMWNPTFICIKGPDKK